MGSDPLVLLALLACFAVVAILATGLGGFGKGSGWAAKNANKLMRYRLAAQFVAVILICIVIYFRRQAG